MNYTIYEKEKNMNKKLSLMLAIVLGFSSVASAGLITFGGMGATDGSVETSGEAGIGWIGGAGSNVIDPTSGYYIETFDAATANPGLPAGLYSDTAGIDIITSGCGVNSYGALAIDVTAGTLGVQSGNTGSGAHNVANSTCFGFTPMPGGGLPSTITVDYTTLLAATPADAIEYFGLYFGSIDTYNTLEFGHIIGGVFTALDISGIGDGNSSLTGGELLDELETQSGDRTNSNVYMNIFFAPDETFTAFRMTTTGVALEVDNIVVGTTARAISEPSTIAILGLSLLGLINLKRKNST